MAISNLLPLFDLSKLDSQLAKLERLVFVFVGASDVVSCFYDGSRYGFNAIK